MEAFASGADAGGARGAIFKQMAEMKKKIQLVEGERKAVFEDCEREKEENKDRIRKLTEEIKLMKHEFQKTSKTGETVLREVKERQHLDSLALRNMTSDSAIQTIDFKVADLKKKLNKLRYETGRKTSRIEALMAQYEKVVSAGDEAERGEEILEESKEGQRLRFLENEIHKTNLKLMEGETIKKKYTSILDMLRKERLTFTNQWEGLEAQIRKQDEEIERLKNTQKTALVTRDNARASQQKQEGALLGESKDRDRKLNENRRLAEDRKNYFDTMERHMFSSKQSTKGTGRESVATSDPQKSSIDEREGEGDEAEEDDKENMYEEAFVRMKRAAGVSEIDEVVHRFETQEDTGKHLTELQNRAEKEIRDLGAVKEKLEAEWELVKFMGQEENTELREKLEELDEDIQDQQIRKKSADEKLQLLNKLLVGIKSGLEIVTTKLYAMDAVGCPPTRNSMEQLSVAEGKLGVVMNRLRGVDVFNKKLEMDEERFVPEGLGYKTNLFEEDSEKKKEDVDSGPEEEEVPTRGYLKRQSNLILDAKSRSKRGGRKR